MGKLPSEFSEAVLSDGELIAWSLLSLFEVIKEVLFFLYYLVWQRL